MAVSAKGAKKPKVVVEEFESDQSDEVDESDEVAQSDEVDECEEEPGDDMVEIKEELNDEEIKEELDDEDMMYDSSGLGDIEIKDTDVDIKEEDDDEEITSGDISEDSDVKMEEDSETESPNSKKKESNSASKQKVEKHVKMMVDNSDETETDSDEDDEFGDPEIQNEADTEDTKSGLADAMAQILATSGDNRAILSKAKKDYMPLKTEDIGEFEFVDNEGNVKSEMKIKVEDEVDPKVRTRQKQLEKEKLIKKFKLKPNIEIDREKERKLRVIATQGVVQLFTAIEKHKAIVRKKQSDTKSVVAREELSSSEFKASFLDILDEEGEKLKRSCSGKIVKKETKEEPIELAPAEKKPKWNVFADNFYKEPTLQGWDVKSDDED